MSGDSPAVKQRFSEVDVVRGCLVLAMVLFHIVFDLGFFTDWQFFNRLIDSWLFDGLQIAIGGGFLFVVGVSLVLSYQRHPSFLHLLKRSGKLLLAALLINLVTWWFMPSAMVYFGILHLIAVGSVLSFNWLKWPAKWWLFIGSMVAISVGMWLNQQTGQSWLLTIVGAPPAYFPTLDYYPLLPWIGCIWLGVFVAQHYYLPRRQQLKIFDLPILQNAVLQTIGRHALLIYLIHQPLIMATLLLAKPILGAKM